MFRGELSSTMLHVLNILNDCEIHSGADIANILHISRTAVWKIVQRLKTYNIPIDTQHLGYRLNSPLKLLDKKKIEDMTKKYKILLEIFESIPSTQEYLKTKLPLKSLNFCLAEHQTKGRGRLGRGWVSPFGKNIYCSFSYIFNKDMSEISGLSLAIGILVVKALESLDPKIKPMLKWPNDIQINHQKVGGILIDTMAEAHGHCKAIIGLGLNINMKNEKLEDIDQPWTSLEHILDTSLDRNRVVIKIIQFVLDGLEVFAERGLEPFLPEWKDYDILQNQKVLICSSGKKASGIAQGITKEGHLLLEVSSGLTEIISSGDASIIK